MLNVGKYTKPMEPLGPGGSHVPWESPWNHPLIRSRSAEMVGTHRNAQHGAFLTGCRKSAVDGITLENLHGTPNKKAKHFKRKCHFTTNSFKSLPRLSVFRLYCFFDGSLKRDGDDRQHLSKTSKNVFHWAKMFARNLFHTDRKSKEELPTEIWMIDNEYRWNFKYLLEFSPWNLGEDETNLTSIFFRWVGSPTSHFLRYIMMHPGAWSLWIGNFHGFGMFLFQTKQGKTMKVQKHQH